MRNARIDHEQAARQLAILGPGLQTYQTLDHDKARNSPQLRRILHGTLDAVLPRLTALQAQGAAVYVCMNQTDGRGRKVANVVRPRCYGADLDGAPLENLERLGLLPALVTESSPGRWWAVYPIIDLPVIETDEQRQAADSHFTMTQKRLAALFGSDPKVTSLSRVMRLAGFQSRWDPPFMARIVVAYTDVKYSESEFQNALAAALAKHCPDHGDGLSNRGTLPSALARAASTPSSAQTRRHAVSAAVTSNIKGAAPAWTPYEDARLRTALAFKGRDGKPVWDADADRSVWGTIVAPALASLSWGERGEAIFIWWSRKSTRPEYQEGGSDFATNDHCRALIRSYKARRDVGAMTEATIIRRAYAAGWNGRPDSSILAEVTAQYGRGR